MTPGLVRRSALDGCGAAPMRHARNVASAPPAGNQARLRRLQAKLVVGSAHDPLEQEADAAADTVMRMADPAVSQVAAPRLSRKCAECEGGLQRATAGTAGGGVTAPAIVDSVLAAPGRPLDPATRAFMSGRFGADFGDVRIHTGDKAARSATAVGARAYTVGRDIVFGAGAYDPRGSAGRRLIAHELAHVIQQGGGGSGLVQRDLATPPPEVAPAAQPDLTDAEVRAAIRFNNDFYDQANIRIIQSILGGAVTGRFTPEHIR